MKDFMVACTASCIDGHVVVYTNYIEDSARGPELVLAYLPNQDKVVTCQLEPVRVYLANL
jgi:ribonuclease PH